MRRKVLLLIGGDGALALALFLHLEADDLHTLDVLDRLPQTLAEAGAEELVAALYEDQLLVSVDDRDHGRKRHGHERRLAFLLVVSRRLVSEGDRSLPAHRSALRLVINGGGCPLLVFLVVRVANCLSVLLVLGLLLLVN